MTTRVLIVNFGPDAVVVKTVPDNIAEIVQPHQVSQGLYYVYQNQDVLIKERAKEPLTV
jgi:hypothetical protein